MSFVHFLLGFLSSFVFVRNLIKDMSPFSVLCAGYFPRLFAILTIYGMCWNAESFYFIYLLEPWKIKNK